MIRRNEHRLLWDPGGSYFPSCSGCGIESEDIFIDQDFDFNEFIKYERSGGDTNVSFFTFPTSQDDEQRIEQKIISAGGTVGGLCTKHLTETIRGIGSFKHLPTTYFPMSLHGYLETLNE